MPSTGENVGPGAYSIAPSARRTRLSAAPFGSTDLRGLHAIVDDKPGPGAYDLSGYSAISAPEPARAKPSLAFASRAPRFRPWQGSGASEVPGPGQYSLPSSIRTGVPAGGAGGLGDGVAERRLLRRSRLQPARSIVTSAARGPPSIPNPRQAFGYVEDEQGQLRAVPAPDAAGAPGPGGYSPSHALLQPRVHTTNFARAPPRVTLFAERRGGPGPGEYDIAREARIAAHARAARPSSNFVSSSVRYFDQHVKAAAKLPGPGQYSMPSAARRSFNVTFDDVDPFM